MNPSATPAPEANPNKITVAEMAAAYLRHATLYYRKGGKATSELGNVKRAIRALRETFPALVAEDFSSSHLIAVQERLIDDGLCRDNVNRYRRIIISIFRWAIGLDLIPSVVRRSHGGFDSILEKLRSVSPLEKGRCRAHEMAPVLPVGDADVEATLPMLREPYATMVRLQLITGMRPGEVCSMRLEDIDRSKAIWIYRPAHHKTEHKDKARIIPLGPKAQALLAPWLASFPGQFMFRTVRGCALSTAAYRNRVNVACDKAEVPVWNPGRLRHSAATRIREQASLDAAQVILGHSSVQTTQIYAEKNLAAALKIAAEVG
jgi:integrase